MSKRAFFHRHFSLLTIILLAGVLFSLPAQAYQVRQSYARISAVAGETLTTGQVVALKDADGLAYKADADDAALRPAVGIVGRGGASGATVEIIAQGVVSGWTALSEGALGYLSGTAAAITQVAPGWNQPLAVATSPTTYYFNFSNYMDTSAITALGVQSQPTAYEGTTANEFETTLSPQDPTADNTVIIPDDGGMLLTSTLTTNGQDVANSVWAVSNGLTMEGASANNFEATITPVDPTADRTVTIPDASGTVDLLSAATHNYAGAAVAWTMTTAEAQATFVSVSNANGAVDAVLPAATAGKTHFVYNNSGQVLTFKVTGGAGGTIATGKYALYVDNGTDVIELYEQP